eukprot:246883_1
MVKNKYLSQQISKKFKNKHRKHTFYPKSFAPRKWKKYRKNSCKRYQKYQCQYGTKKELRRLKKQHLKQCQCKLQNNGRNANNKNNYNLLNDYNFINCQDLNCYGLETRKRKNDNLQQCGCDWCTGLKSTESVYNEETSIIADSKYESVYNWKSLKSTQKNKYLSQTIRKKFKNKRKNNLYKKQSKQRNKMRKGKKYKTKMKYKTNKKSQRKENILLIDVIKKGYDGLSDITNFSDYDDEEQDEEQNSKRVDINKLQQKEKQIQYISWRSGVMFVSWRSGVPYLSFDNRKQHQFNTEQSLINFETLTGNIILNENGTFQCIKIDDIDISKQKYWNKKIYHVISSNIEKNKRLYGGERVIFAINVKLLKNLKVNKNKIKLCWCDRLKNKFRFVADNVRLTKQVPLTLNRDIDLLVAGYLSIYLHRYNFYIPKDIEQLIRHCFAMRIESTWNKPNRFNYYFYTFVKRQSNSHWICPNTHTMISKFALKRNTSYSLVIEKNGLHSHCFVGIVSKPHQLYKYLDGKNNEILSSIEWW